MIIFNKKILNSLLIICILISSSIFAAPNKNVTLKWGNYIVKTIPSTGNQGDSNYKGAKLEFTNQKTKKIDYTHEIDYPRIIDLKIEKMKNQNALILLTSSGGESGGTLTLWAFTFENNKIIKNTELDFSGYSDIKFIDADNDGNKEVFIDSIRFNNRDFGCFSIPIYAVIGSSKLYYPQIFKLMGHKFIAQPISSINRKMFNEYFTKTEKLLLTNKGIILNTEKELEHNFIIINILEYYYNLSKINDEKKAITHIKNSNINILCKNKSKISFFDFIIKNKALILKDK